MGDMKRGLIALVCHSDIIQVFALKRLCGADQAASHGVILCVSRHGTIYV